MPKLVSARALPAALVLTAAVVTLGSLVPLEALRALLTLGPSLLLPGAALLYALGGVTRRSDPVPTLVLAVVLSVAYYALSAIAFYAAGGRLTSTSIAVLLDVWVLIMVGIGLVSPGRASVPLLAAAPAQGRATGAWGVWLLGVVLAGAAAVGLGIVLLPKQPPTPYLSIAFTGSWATTAGTRVVPAGAEVAVPLAVHNAYPAREHVSVSATLDGKPFGVERLLDLRATSSWYGALRGRMGTSGCLQQLVVELTRGSQPKPVASLDMWLSQRAPSCPGQG